MSYKTVITNHIAHNKQKIFKHSTLKTAVFWNFHPLTRGYTVTTSADSG